MRSPGYPSPVRKASTTHRPLVGLTRRDADLVLKLTLPEGSQRRVPRSCVGREKHAHLLIFGAAWSAHISSYHDIASG